MLKEFDRMELRDVMKRVKLNGSGPKLLISSEFEPLGLELFMTRSLPAGSLNFRKQCMFRNVWAGTVHVPFNSARILRDVSQHT